MHKAGGRYTVITAFESVKYWSEKFKEISMTLERKLVRDVSKGPRTTAKTVVNDSAKSGIVVSMKAIAIFQFYLFNQAG